MSCLGQTCLNARSRVMLEEHEVYVDDYLEVREQSVDEDEEVTIWSITYDEDDDDDD